MKLKQLLQKVNFQQVLQQLIPNPLPVPIEIFMTIFVSVLTSIAQDITRWEQYIQPEELAAFIVDAMINGPARVLGVIDGERIDVNPLIYANQLQK